MVAKPGGGGEITPTDNVSIDPEIPQGIAMEKKMNKLIGSCSETHSKSKAMSFGK